MLLNDWNFVDDSPHNLGQLISWEQSPKYSFPRKLMFNGTTCLMYNKATYVFDVFQIYVCLINSNFLLSLPLSFLFSSFIFFHKWITSYYCLCIFDCPCNLSYCRPGQILTLINCWVIMNVSSTVFSWQSVVLQAFSFNGRLLKGDLAFILLLFQLQRVDVKGIIQRRFWCHPRGP